MKSRTKIDKQMRRKRNPAIVGTILSAKKKDKWLEIAHILSRPRSKKVSVNLDKIDSESSEGDTILVPGKVLGKGDVSKKLKVIALSFSEEAERKLKEKGCEVAGIKSEIKSNPDITGIKIIKE